MEESRGRSVEVYNQRRAIAVRVEASEKNLLASKQPPSPCSERDKQKTASRRMSSTLSRVLEAQQEELCF